MSVEDDIWNIFIHYALRGNPLEPHLVSVSPHGVGEMPLNGVHAALAYGRSA
jgi:hypothetical protein